ncbi:triacylglycerol esterase/lipase EstA (alpha/beta hydrolase family) [Luteibacter sp. Sphag1AF]|uniref:esterase/lipase family protein n=1 Tax=Luteibacter sp. Sphag1AF TaxID=2587031 RepID=UPI001609C6F1|nr:alpha/beta fold hydrolase [Luteibacter sp. Sphag1AF]MBB3229107.1 triacylglycerol esterase/lipase EstA (alpha/beta hydrolase family) [Luteibacter sp. Sphag1AF]
MLSLRVFLLATVLLACSACNMVGIRQVAPRDYVNERRSDVLSTRRLSDSTIQTLNVVAVPPDDCVANLTPCENTLAHSLGLNDEQRYSALAELWLDVAVRADPSSNTRPLDDRALDAYMRSARYAYIYLFRTSRTPEQRAFELRQVQVIDFYNFATQRAMTRFFDALPTLGTGWTRAQIAGWTIRRPRSDVLVGDNGGVPAELIAASGLRFKGLRNVYKRDGFGSEFVAVAAPDSPDDNRAWRNPDYAPLTGTLEFAGDTPDSVLAVQDVSVVASDPYHDKTVTVGGQSVPLAANFTAPYGVWLARSGFASQSIRSLLGREGGLKTPRVLFMQPYDPNRITVIMLHGLASSPEAWVNVANEVMGDDELRRTYQIWQVYYPTNLPVAVNLANIRKALDATFQHVDPSGTAPASHNIVLIGHSMGGVIARLLVSTSDNALWQSLPLRRDLSPERERQVRERLKTYVNFSPMPGVTRAIFLASPHRGTPTAQFRLARWIGNLIRLPADLLKEVASLSDAWNPGADGASARIPNAVDNLSDKDPFLRASADLPISPAVHYHTIVGVYKSEGPLATSSDGVVPYSSAHLNGADSELAVPSWHSVQETPQAILELRRILRLHAAAVREEMKP